MSGPKQAITTPFWDGFCIGGASILGMVALTVARFGFGVEFDADGAFALVLLMGLNLPHFMASYPVLYGDRDQIRDHRFASFYVPGVLLAVVALVVVDVDRSFSDPLVAGLTVVGALYLAVHYTGQAFGVMSTFAMLEGLRFEPDERRLLRGGLQLLMIYHVLFALGIVGELLPGSVARWLGSVHGQMMAVGRPLATLGIGLGVFGLCLVKSRGKALPPRVLLPWLAIQLWYPFYTLVDPTPFAFVWVQVSHALQYLIFPMRVNSNRRMDTPPERRRVVLMIDFALWVVIGFALMKSLSTFSVFAGESYRYTDYTSAVSTSVVMAINIHHYFIDGVIWKLRNPAVRRELTLHLQPEAAPG